MQDQDTHEYDPSRPGHPRIRPGHRVQDQDTHEYDPVIVGAGRHRIRPLRSGSGAAGSCGIPHAGTEAPHASGGSDILHIEACHTGKIPGVAADQGGAPNRGGDTDGNVRGAAAR